MTACKSRRESNKQSAMTMCQSIAWRKLLGAVHVSRMIYNGLNTVSLQLTGEY